MELRCTLDGLRRALWFSVEGTSIKMLVRMRHNSNLPHWATSLDGKVLTLDELAALLPIRGDGYQPTTCRAPAELRREADGWSFLVMKPFPNERGLLEQCRNELLAWAAEKLAPDVSGAVDGRARGEGG